MRCDPQKLRLWTLHGAKPEWLRAIITRQDSELVFARTQVSAMKVQVLAPAANESGDKSPQSKLNRRGGSQTRPYGVGARGLFDGRERGSSLKTKYLGSVIF